MIRCRAVGWVLLFLLLAGTVRADPQPLDLAACRRLARERQPALAAFRASLARAQAGVRALDALVLVEVIRKDLPYRRQQSAHGVVIAQALLAQAEAETISSVTRTYLTALFAQEQQRVADAGIAELETSLKNVPDIELDNPQIHRLQNLLDLARGRRVEAVTGYQRALAALAEAIGLESPEGWAIAGGSLPDLDPAIDPRSLLELSVQRRPELIMAVEIAEVAVLEVRAQGVAKGITVGTFASGGDLHAEALPPGSSDGEYRPKPVGPEMPTTLTGCKNDRVAQAQALAARAAAVVVKTRNLVTLDARDALARWQGLKTRRTFTKKAAEAAKKEVADLVGDFQTSPLLPGDAKVGLRLAQIIDAGLLSAIAGLEDNQVRFDLLLVLAKLEQITHGAFNPGFE